MKKLLMKYFRNANSYQSIDPTCFNLKEFTETWLEENKEAINYAHSSLQLKEKNKNSIVGFENYIAKVHPDPDSVLIDNIQRWEQIVLLAENYAKQ